MSAFDFAGGENKLMDENGGWNVNMLVVVCPVLCSALSVWNDDSSLCAGDVFASSR